MKINVPLESFRACPPQGTAPRAGMQADRPTELLRLRLRLLDPQTTVRELRQTPEFEYSFGPLLPSKQKFGAYVPLPATPIISPTMARCKPDRERSLILHRANLRASRDASCFDSDRCAKQWKSSGAKEKTGNGHLDATAPKETRAFRVSDRRCRHLPFPTAHSGAVTGKRPERAPNAVCREVTRGRGAPARAHAEGGASAALVATTTLMGTGRVGCWNLQALPLQQKPFLYVSQHALDLSSIFASTPENPLG